jgi:hypothetical protein
MIDLPPAWHTQRVPTREAISRLLWVVVGLAGAGACVGDDDPTLDPVLGPAEASASIPVEGGVLELDDGARLSFPPGALNEPTDVTLRRLGCGGVYQAASFGGCRYAVEGPEGALAAPYELEIPTRGPACATQQTVDGMVCIFGAQSSGDAVTTLSADFGEFTAWADDAVLPTDACVMPSFDACGGDLIGRWVMTDACGTVEQLTNSFSTGPNPYEDCGPLDYYRGSPFSVSGAFEFLAEDYTMSTGYTIMRHEFITPECLTVADQPCHELCEMVDGICQCLFVESEGFGSSGGDTWTLGAEPGTVQLGSVTQRYCVEGDTLTLEWGSGDERYYTVYARE